MKNKPKKYLNFKFHIGKDLAHEHYGLIKMTRKQAMIYLKKKNPKYQLKDVVVVRAWNS